jgi:hypothetical protein
MLDGRSIVEVSTTVRALDQRSGVTKAENVRYTLSRNGIALAGNLKNGSDAIKTTDALIQVIELCWKERDVVIVDPVRCSKKFVDWIRNYPRPMAALFIYLDISLEENLRRLLGRRRANALAKGKPPEEALPEKTYRHLLSVRNRARNVWFHACTNYDRLPKHYLVIPEHFSPTDSATAIRTALEHLHENGDFKNEVAVELSEAL